MKKTIKYEQFTSLSLEANHRQLTQVEKSNNAIGLQEMDNVEFRVKYTPNKRPGFGLTKALTGTILFGHTILDNQYYLTTEGVYDKTKDEFRPWEDSSKTLISGLTISSTATINEATGNIYILFNGAGIATCVLSEARPKLIDIRETSYRPTDEEIKVYGANLLTGFPVINQGWFHDKKGNVKTTITGPIAQSTTKLPAVAWTTNNILYTSGFFRPTHFGFLYSNIHKEPVLYSPDKSVYIPTTFPVNLDLSKTYIVFDGKQASIEYKSKGITTQITTLADLKAKITGPLWDKRPFMSVDIKESHGQYRIVVYEPYQPLTSQYDINIILLYAIDNVAAGIDPQSSDFQLWRKHKGGQFVLVPKTDYHINDNSISISQITNISAQALPDDTFELRLGGRAASTVTVTIPSSIVAGDKDPQAIADQLTFTPQTLDIMQSKYIIRHGHTFVLYGNGTPNVFGTVPVPFQNDRISDGGKHAYFVNQNNLYLNQYGKSEDIIQMFSWKDLLIAWGKSSMYAITGRGEILTNSAGDSQLSPYRWVGLDGFIGIQAHNMVDNAMNTVVFYNDGQLIGVKQISIAEKRVALEVISYEYRDKLKDEPAYWLRKDQESIKFKVGDIIYSFEEKNKSLVRWVSETIKDMNQCYILKDIFVTNSIHNIYELRKNPLRKDPYKYPIGFFTDNDELYTMKLRTHKDPITQDFNQMTLLRVALMFKNYKYDVISGFLDFYGNEYNITKTTKIEFIKTNGTLQKVTSTIPNVVSGFKKTRSLLSFNGIYQEYGYSVIEQDISPEFNYVQIEFSSMEDNPFEIGFIEMDLNISGKLETTYRK